MSEPEPPEDPPEVPTLAGAVLQLLARQRCGEPEIAIEAIEAAVEQVTALARAYTRGNGFAVSFDGGSPNPDISAVIVTAAARLAANPYQFPVELPSGAHSHISYRGAFTGWTTAELAALNRYRRRAM